MNNYDNWKLASPNENCKCDRCEMESKSLNEVTGSRDYETMCDDCAEDFNICGKCERVIIKSDFAHDELCDNCCFSLSEAYDED